MSRSSRTLATALVLLGVVSITPVQAAVFEVTKTNDTADGACDRDCSLREAITAANNLDGPDVVLVGPGIFPIQRAGAGEDANAGGDLDVLDDLTVVGKTPALTVLSSNGNDRVLHVGAGVTAELRSVSIANGRTSSPAGGGGILNFGRLTLSEVSVFSNTATGGASGGGIRSEGADASLTVTDSAVVNNTSEGAGGGILAGGTLELANVTISGNRSTIGFGGGLYTFNNLNADITNTTITANSAQRGGGLYVESVPFLTTDYPEVRNTILAGNTAPADADCSGAAVSRGYNLVGVGGGCIDFKAARNDLTGTAAAPLNPRLQALGTGGGFTPSHAPLGNSPVLNAGNPAPPSPPGGSGCEAFDQRGLKRTGRCDIGAVEIANGCVEGDLSLCLNNNRFQVSTVFTQSRVPQPAHAVETTGDTGYFWFFDPSSVEVTVKVLNGCGSNGRYWVYVAGLTNLGATVTDTVTGTTKTYTNPQGRNFRPMYDTSFAPCGS